MHPVDGRRRPRHQDRDGKHKGGAQVGEFDGVEAVEFGPEFAEGAADGAQQDLSGCGVSIEAGVAVAVTGLVVVRVGAGIMTMRRGGALAGCSGVGGAVVGGVGVAHAADATTEVGGLFQVGFGLAGGGQVGGVVDVDGAEGRGVGAAGVGTGTDAGVDGGGRDDVVFAVGRGGGGAVRRPRMDAVVVDTVAVDARRLCGKGDLGDGWGR